MEKNISRKENDTVKKMEMDLDAALTDMVPLTKVTVAVWCLVLAVFHNPCSFRSISSLVRLRR